MTLAEKLRERASALRRTAQITCGELGQVTIEALSLRDAELLLRSGDSQRRIFYAACRELQRAGEELRKRGEITAPDGILQFISDAEAEAAAQAVLTLSGIALPAPQKMGEDIAASGGGEEIPSAPEAAEGHVPSTPEQAPAVENEPVTALPIAPAAEKEAPTKQLEELLSPEEVSKVAVSSPAADALLSPSAPTASVLSEEEASAGAERSSIPPLYEPAALSQREDAALLERPHAAPSAAETLPAAVNAGHTPQPALTEGTSKTALPQTELRAAPLDATRPAAETPSSSDAALAERVARQILTGLRRAAYVR